MDNKIAKTLKRFGLTENETKIYLESLKREETSPNELAKATKIPRTTIYDIIMSLSLKGLVELQQSDGFTKQQTKIKAINPSKLREIIRQKHKDLYSLEVDIVDILPVLKGDFQQEKPNADFQFYPGIEGVKKVYFGSMDDVGDQANRYTFECLMPADTFGSKDLNKEVSKWNIERGQMHEHEKEIVALNDWTKHVLSYQYARDSKYLEFREIRYIDSPIFSINQMISVIGSRIEIATAHKDEVWGMIVNSDSLAKTFLSFFHLIWSTAHPVTEGLIKSWGENKYLEAERKKS